MTAIAIAPALAREPPNSIEAERSVLGGVLIKPAAWDDVTAAPLIADEFYLPAHREIFGALGAVVARGGAIDFVSLSDELKTRGQLSRLQGGEAYLIEMANGVPTAENMRHYVRIVKDKAMLRRLALQASEIHARAMGGQLSAVEVLEEAQLAINSLATGDASDAPVELADAVDDVLADMERRVAQAKSGQIIGVPTGLWAFDRATGGLQNEWLVVLGADAKVGKTAWATGAAIAAATAGIPVLIFAAEMDLKTSVMRALSSLGEVDGGKMLSGRLDQQDWQAIHRGAKKAHALKIAIRVGKIGTGHLCAVARRWRAKYPDRQVLVIADYLQILEHDGDHDREDQAIGASSWALKMLAEQLKCPVLALSQITVVEGKHRTRGSRRIEQDANLVLFVRREDGKADERGEQAATLSIEFFRHGPTGSYPMIWQGPFTRFVNPTAGDGQEEMAYGA